MSASTQAAAPPRRTRGWVWTWPLLVGVGSSAGLVAALVGDGVWDALSWLLLGVPVAISVWAWRRRAR